MHLGPTPTSSGRVTTFKCDSSRIALSIKSTVHVGFTMASVCSPSSSIGNLIPNAAFGRKAVVVVVFFLIPHVLLTLFWF